MKRNRRRDGFTMLELLATITIIFTLAGLLLAGATMAQRAARIKKSEATINALMAACEEYWAAYRDYPYWWYSGQTDITGLSADPAFRSKYLSGTTWDDEAYNVVFCWFMSKKRVPEPFISLDKRWYKRVDELKAPDNRDLYRVIDGFDLPIRIQRPTQYYLQRTYVRFISAGPDMEWDTEDDIKRELRR